MEWEGIASIAAMLALIATVLIFILSSTREARTRLIDNFNSMYQKTFALRTELNLISQSVSNEDFYYELDRILHCNDVQDKVLDYLTEMEDFFFLVIGHRSVFRSFEKLMSLPLYQRLTTLYGFIIRRRQQTNNTKFFSNYEKALVKIGQMNKIKKQLPKSSNYHYVGIRSSDRMYDHSYFQSDITIFSEAADTRVFPIRPNQNKSNKNVFPYFIERINTLIKKNSSCRFMFYNGTMAYGLPQELQKYFICLNPRELLNYFNDKPEVKRWFSSHKLPILPYETFCGQEIKWETLQQHFPNTDRYVIQSSSGGGGIGTFMVSESNFEAVRSILQPFRQYVVSAYIEHSISVNTHIFLSDKQTILSPGSVQIVEYEENQLCYRGADFIAFRTLPVSCREQVRELSLRIANRLREYGYRGIAGIDFLISKDQAVYCMEVNPRFQASTPLIDLFLQEQPSSRNMAHSVYELNEQAFFNQMISTLCFDDEINYSCYYYYKGDLPLEDLLEKRSLLLDEHIIIHDDGVMSFAKEDLLDQDSYLFRAIFPHTICAVSPDMTLWRNDNVPVKPAPKDLLGLKIALLNQGVRISGPTEHVKVGSYDSIDIAFYETVPNQQPVLMNCAYRTNLSQFSPFQIKLAWETGGEYDEVMYYGKTLGRARVETNKLAGLSELDRGILYLATDRLRIKLVAGCEYKNIGCGCAFCNLKLSDRRFSREELQNALARFKETGIPFRHILIGGGSCLEPDIWEDVIWLCQFLKSDGYYEGKPISLMSILPPEEMLPILHEAGLEEVAFNLEVSDDDLARKLMPGKRAKPKAAYYSTLSKAVEVFGKGAVRSALLVGFDQDEALIGEVLRLASIGVIPCLSAFRALNGSVFAKAIHPDNASLRRIYDICSARLATADGDIHELGPKCLACRNNMLAI